MKIYVDRKRCSGIGICESIDPELFEIGDDGALILHNERPTAEQMERAQEAVIACPAAALTWVAESASEEEQAAS